MKLKDKAISLIETLVSDDLSERLEYDTVMDRPIHLPPEDIRVLANKLSTIYKIAHSVREDAICYEVHGDWREEISKLYRRYKKAKLI